MGANAQTTVPTFTAGQTLTAAQVNQINTGIPVASGTATRDGLFGGSGEKTLGEGQLVYVESLGLQSYNGSSWVTWGTAPSTGALTLITAVSFTSQTTVAFANDIFTSTYTRYLISLQAESTSGDSTVTMQVRDNSGAKSTAAYIGAFVGEAYDGNDGSFATNAGTSFSMGRAGQDQQSVWQFTVFNPTSTTLYTSWAGTAFLRSNGTNFSIGAAFGGNYSVNEAHTGLSLAFSVSATGTYRVYGYADA